MYSLEVIKSDLFQAQSISKGNFDRDGSVCFSRRGAVIHSGVLRSTAFVEADCTLYGDLRYWIKQEKEALNAFIDSLVYGLNDTQANRNACKVSRPGWTFKQRNGRKIDACIQAKRTSGKLVELQESTSWKAIHYQTRH